MSGYPRKPPGTHIGRRGKRDEPSRLAQWKDSAGAQHPSLRGQTRRASIPIPDADERWRPEAQTWFRSLKLSGQSSLYEASDWATAVAAAQAYDIFLRTYNASLLAHFVGSRAARRHSRRPQARPNRARRARRAPRRGCEHADNVIQGWQERLNARRDKE